MYWRDKQTMDCTIETRCQSSGSRRMIGIQDEQRNASGGHVSVRKGRVRTFATKAQFQLPAGFIWCFTWRAAELVLEACRCQLELVELTKEELHIYRDEISSEGFCLKGRLCPSIRSTRSIGSTGKFGVRHLTSFCEADAMALLGQKPMVHCSRARERHHESCLLSFEELLEAFPIPVPSAETSLSLTCKHLRFLGYLDSCWPARFFPLSDCCSLHQACEAQRYLRCER